MTLVLCACRKSPVFSVSMEIDLVFEMVEIDLIPVWGIEVELISVQGWRWFDCCVSGGIDLLLVCWPNITCFYDEHENWLGFWVDGPIWHEFSVGDRTGHHFNVGVKLVWLLCGWSKLTRFCTRGENNLFLVWAVECCGLSKLAWFQCGGPNLSRF